MAMAAPIYYTADMVRALPDDGRRHEVVYGELFLTPAPRVWHQVVLDRLYHAVREYLGGHPELMVFQTAADISWDPSTLVQPDLFVARAEELRALRWEAVRSLVLVAEVLSHSTARADRFAKRRRYQEAGIPIYWIVDPDEARVEVWTPEADFPVLETDRLLWRPAGASAPFDLPIATLFRPL